jgi:ABC-2 type transport system permease protein
MLAIRQLFRLWRIYAWLDFMWVTRSFRYFIVYYVADALINVATISAMLLLAERFGGIGAWSKWQIVFMLGYGLLTTSLLDTFFGYNVRFISRRLGRGQFDHTLIQPQPVWMALLTDGFNPFGTSSSVVAGLAMLVWSAGHISLKVSPEWWALFALNVLSSGAIMLAVNFVWGSLAFWAPRATEEITTSIVRMFDQLKAFPLEGLGGLLLGAMLTAMPVGLVAWYPSRFLLGLDATPAGGFVTAIAALAAGVLAALIFTKGMRHYERTGSQRYRAMGHRG